MGAPDTLSKKWTDTIDAAKKDARWNELDTNIQTAVTAFNTHLKASKGYVAVDWKLIKAMVWTESGGPDSDAWTTRPMQIGNPGDPGLDSLLSGKEGGELIIPPLIKPKLTKLTAGTAAMNIYAGVGYLLMRAATYETVSVPDATDTKVKEVVVKAGDNPSKIAAANNSTLDMLKKLNPKIMGILKPGDKIKVQRASMQKQIKSWSLVNVQFAANKYNVGDKLYAKKLQYCLAIINEAK